MLPALRRDSGEMQARPVDEPSQDIRRVESIVGGPTTSGLSATRTIWQMRHRVAELLEAAALDPRAEYLASEAAMAQVRFASIDSGSAAAHHGL